MVKDRRRKREIRERMERTGENYTVAARAVNEAEEREEDEEGTG